MQCNATLPQTQAQICQSHIMQQNISFSRNKTTSCNNNNNNNNDNNDSDDRRNEILRPQPMPPPRPPTPLRQCAIQELFALKPTTITNRRMNKRNAKKAKNVLDNTAIISCSFFSNSSSCCYSHTLVYTSRCTRNMPSP